MGFFADKITEVAKLNRMNVDIQSAEKVEESISETISMIEKIDTIKANEARKSIIGMIETDISKYITDKGEIKLDEFIKNVEHIKQETLNDRNDISDDNNRRELVEEKEQEQEKNGEIENDYDFEKFGNDIDIDIGDIGDNENEFFGDVEPEKVTKALGKLAEKYGEFDPENIFIKDRCSASAIRAINEGDENKKSEYCNAALEEYYSQGKITTKKYEELKALFADKSQPSKLKMAHLYKIDPGLIPNLLKSKNKDLTIENIKEFVEDLDLNFEDYKKIYSDGIPVKNNEEFLKMYKAYAQMEGLSILEKKIKGMQFDSIEEFKKFVQSDKDLSSIGDESIEKIFTVLQSGELSKTVSYEKMVASLKYENMVESNRIANLEDIIERAKSDNPAEVEQAIFDAEHIHGMKFDDKSEVPIREQIIKQYDKAKKRWDDFESQYQIWADEQGGEDLNKSGDFELESVSQSIKHYLNGNIKQTERLQVGNLREKIEKYKKSIPRLKIYRKKN